MKVCPKCSQSFADGFTYCPKDAARLEKYDLRARMQRPEVKDEFNFLLESEPLIGRLKRELRSALNELRINPRAFLKGLLRGEGNTRQRKRLLQAGLAMGLIVYASVFMTALLFNLPISDQQVTAAPPKAPPKKEPYGDFVIVMSPIPQKVERAKENAKSGAGHLGGSLRQRQPRRARGGGGHEDELPASRGDMPAPTTLPQINPPDLKPPKPNPALIVPETIIADDAFRRRINGPFGLRNSQTDAPSLGNGKGTGVGPGDGPGYDRGDGGGTGGGRMRLGSWPPNGPGDGEVLMSRNLRPTILHREKAKYTEEARQQKVQGTVVLSAVFGADGRIRDIRTVRGLPHGLTETSIEATQKIRFHPAIQNGKPVSVRATLEFNFALY